MLNVSTSLCTWSRRGLYCGIIEMTAITQSLSLPFRCTRRTDSSLKWTRHLWNNRHGLQRTDWEESLREIASQKSLIIFSKAFVVCFSYNPRWITLLRTLLSPRGSIEVVSKLLKLYQINYNRAWGLMLEKVRLYL